MAQLDELLDVHAFTERIEANGHIAAIIGKGGVTIKGIREKTGAGVDLIGDMVKLTGTQEAVTAAKVSGRGAHTQYAAVPLRLPATACGPHQCLLFARGRSKHAPRRELAPPPFRLALVCCATRS